MHGIDEVRECIKGIKEIPNRYANTIFRFLCEEDAYFEFSQDVVDHLRSMHERFCKESNDLYGEIIYSDYVLYYLLIIIGEEPMVKYFHFDKNKERVTEVSKSLGWWYFIIAE